MPTTVDYLNQLEQDREDLVDNLETKGITGLTGDETFTELVPEVLNISSGGGNVAHPSYVSFEQYPGTTLDISWLRIDNMTSLDSMFFMCNALTGVDTSLFQTSHITSFASMFANCTQFTSYNFNFDITNATTLQSMFSNCSNMQTFTFGNNISTTKSVSLSDMFGYCSALQTIDLSNFSTPNANSLYQMFANCSNLTSVNFGNNTYNKVTSVNGMFRNCTSLQSIVFPTMEAGLTQTQDLFSGCTGLVTADLSKFKCSYSTNIRSMFSNCTALETIDLSNLELAGNYSVTATEMFYNCTSLTRLDMRKYNFTRITNLTNMFTNVPANCLIIVADTTQKDWFTTKFPSLTNVKTVAEL